MIAYAMDQAGRIATWDATEDLQAWQGDSWLWHPAGFDAAVKAANAVLEAARPPGKVEPSAEPLDHPLMLLSHLSNDKHKSLMQVKEALSPATLKRITRNAEQASSGSTSP